MRILIVDDEAAQRRMLAEYLAEQGHDVLEAGEVDAAYARLQESPIDLVLTDVRMPGSDGISLIRRARAGDIDAEFLVMTAYGTIENAVEAVRAGAHDYLPKPIRLDDLDASISRLQQTAPRSEPVPGQPHPFESLGPAMQHVRALVDRVAPSEATVLVTGESGVGKEVVAGLLHENSRRARGAFVKLNCAAFPDSLLDAELFGHTQGAYTGAAHDRAGLFESAHGGTILLDEIGDVSPATQVRLLRVLQEREVRRLGSAEATRVDCRVVAATNRDLEAMVEDGTFRRDLLYRLRVVEIHVPPLRERPEDIPVLSERFLRTLSRRHRLARKALSPEAQRLLAGFHYPGNVRQLQHVLERALILSEGPVIEAHDLSRDVLDENAGQIPRSLRDAVASLEKSWIRRALDESGHVQARAAEHLGIPERVLRYKVRKYGIAVRRRQ